MTRPLIATALLIGGVCLATQARAGDDATLGDVRCVVVAMSMARSRDPYLRATGTTSGLYFMGRLEGRAPELDLTPILAEQIRALGPADLEREAGRCTRLVQALDAKLQAIGAGLQATARDSPGPAAQAIK